MTRIYHSVPDKESWGDGPWVDEPDKMQWVDTKTDLDCLIVRGPGGQLCGYVGVPPEHPLHGVEYGRVEASLEVHGGLTFSDSCDENATEDRGICHVPEPGRPKDVWWFGFDCAHFMDIAPAFEMRTRELCRNVPALGPWELHGTYKPLRYVIEEVRSLSRQLARIDVEAIDTAA